MKPIYSILAAQFILRDIGECSCVDCALFYVLEFRSCLKSARQRVLGLAKENCLTGAINMNLGMKDEE